MIKTWCTLALLACAQVQAATPATEAQWIAAARAAVAFGQAQGLPIELEVQSGDGLSGHTPVGIWSENGRCTLVVSARENPTADRVSSMVDPSVLDLFLTGAAIHEVGHCHRRLQGYPHNEKLLPIVAWITPVKQWFTRRILTEEAYADMTEVAWLARYHPQQYEQVMQEIYKVRTRFREPKHDTLPWLDIAMADGPKDDGRDLFLLADMHLSRYR
ncbi:MAG TPA: hypothetical protein VGC21_10355 [Telluria sp.]|jgi:hypothetical protein